MKRRTFIKAGAVGAESAVAAPAIVKADTFQ